MVMGRRSRRLLLIVLVVVVAAYGGASWVFSERLIGQQFVSDGSTDFGDLGLPDPEEATIRGDGVDLAAWYFQNPADAGCAVVMLHGYGGDRAEILGANPLFWDRGCHLLSYDARGHGESSRALLTFGAHEHEDLRLATDWLATRTDLPQSSIGLIGWSYGAATAIQAAPDLPEIAFVIADSSFSSLTDIANVQGERQIGPWISVFIPGALFVAGLRAGFDPATAAPTAAITEARMPVLLVHSRTDGYTPVGHSEAIFGNSDHDRTRLIIPDWDAPHARSHEVDPVAYTGIVDQFLDDFAPGFGAPREP